jgi:hypothetical protein
VEAILPLARERRIGLDHEPFLLACLARATSRSGEHVQAISTAREAVEKARQYGTRLWEIPARLSLAAALHRADAVGNAEAARAELEAAQGLIEETGGRAFQPWHDRLDGLLTPVRDAS